MTRSTSQLIVHLCLLLLPLAALMNVSILSWTETLRLLLILGGLVVLYVRYRGTLQSDASVARGASVILALVVAFLVTQFDPATASLHYRSPQTRLNPFFVVSTLLILAATVPSLVAYRQTLVWRSLGSLDRVVMLVILGATIVTVGSRWVSGESMDAAFALGVLKLAGYLFIWVAVTRVYGDSDWTVDASDSVSSFVRKRWQMPLLLLCVLFVPSIVSGVYRTLAVIYYVGEGQKHYEAEAWAAAEGAYARASELNSVVDLGFARDRYLEDLAVLRLRSGDKEKAGQLIGRLRAATYDRNEAEEKTGDVYLRAGEWAQAARSYERVLEERGKDTAVINRLGISYLRRQDSRRFLELSNKYDYVPSVEAATFDEVVFVGNVHFYRESFHKAESFFRRASQLRQNDAYAEYKVGRALLADGKARAAMTQFERAVELESNFADAYYRLGECHEQLGDLESAREFYLETVKILPTHLDGLMKLKEEEEG